MARSTGVNYKPGDNTAHREYYAQFVTEGVLELVTRGIGIERLLMSTDPHLNDIPLAKWDALVPFLGTSVRTLLRQAGEGGMTLGVGVCILKEAARQFVECTDDCDVCPEPHPVKDFRCRHYKGEA